MYVHINTIIYKHVTIFYCAIPFHTGPEGLWGPLVVLFVLMVVCITCHLSIALYIKFYRKYKRSRKSRSKHIREMGVSGTGSDVSPGFIEFDRQRWQESSNDACNFEESGPPYDEVKHSSPLDTDSGSDSDTMPECTEDTDPSQYAVLYAVVNSTRDTDRAVTEPYVSPYATSPIIPLPTQIIEEAVNRESTFGSIEYVNVRHAEMCWEKQRSCSSFKNSTEDANN